jgi:hypothetical protein
VPGVRTMYEPMSTLITMSSKISGYATANSHIALPLISG